MSILELVSTIGWDNDLLCGEYIGNPPNTALQPICFAGAPQTAEREMLSAFGQNY